MTNSLIGKLSCELDEIADNWKDAGRPLTVRCFKVKEQIHQRIYDNVNMSTALEWKEKVDGIFKGHSKIFNSFRITKLVELLTKYVCDNVAVALLKWLFICSLPSHISQSMYFSFRIYCYGV